MQRPLMTRSSKSSKKTIALNHNQPLFKWWVCLNHLVCLLHRKFLSGKFLILKFLAAESTERWNRYIKKKKPWSNRIGLGRVHGLLLHTVTRPSTCSVGTANDNNNNTVPTRRCQPPRIAVGAARHSHIFCRHMGAIARNFESRKKEARHYFRFFINICLQGSCSAPMTYIKSPNDSRKVDRFSLSSPLLVDRRELMGKMITVWVSLIHFLY